MLKNLVVAPGFYRHTQSRPGWRDCFDDPERRDADTADTARVSPLPVVGQDGKFRTYPLRDLVSRKLEAKHVTP